jgi:hypothetical protein
VRGIKIEEAENPMTPWLRYLIAFVVFCHGFIYVRIGSVLPGPIQGWRGSLHVTAGVAVLACALAIGFAPSLAGWWRPLAIAGGTIGVAAFAVFWDGQTRLLFEEGVVGAVLSAILLAAAMFVPAANR